MNTSISPDDSALYVIPQKGGFTPQQSIIGFTCGILLYTISFTLCWYFMDKYWPRFRNDYSLSKKADNCSRFNSCLNCVLVTPLLLYGLLSMRWGPHYEPLDDPWLIQLSLFIAMGYFIQDMYVTFRYKTPLWPVFLLHHFMATVPYGIYFFVDDCGMGVLILGCFMLVEGTNVFYNGQQWLEDVDRTDNVLYVFLVYSNVVGWVVLRLMNPTFCMWAAEKYIIPSARPGQGNCLKPGAFCGYFVNVFCYTAFFVRILKDVIVNRWLNDPKKKKREKKTENSNTDASRSGGRRREAKKEQ